jgi:hypothetical protein
LSAAPGHMDVSWTAISHFGVSQMLRIKALRYLIATVFALMVVNVAVHTEASAVEYRVRNPQVAPQKDLTKAKQCNQACSDAYQACLRSTAPGGCGSTNGACQLRCHFKYED